MGEDRSLSKIYIDLKGLVGGFRLREDDVQALVEVNGP
jgi:hypothetical protein